MYSGRQRTISIMRGSECALRPLQEARFVLRGYWGLLAEQDSYVKNVCLYQSRNCMNVLIV